MIAHGPWWVRSVIVAVATLMLSGGADATGPAAAAGRPRVDRFDVERAWRIVRAPARLRPAPRRLPAAPAARAQAAPAAPAWPLRAAARPARPAQRGRHATRPPARDRDRRALRHARRAAWLRRRQQRRRRHRRRDRGGASAEPRAASRRGSPSCASCCSMGRSPRRGCPRRAPTSTATGLRGSRAYVGSPSRPHRGDDPARLRR